MLTCTEGGTLQTKPVSPPTPPLHPLEPCFLDSSGHYSAWQVRVPQWTLSSPLLTETRALCPDLPVGPGSGDLGILQVCLSPQPDTSQSVRQPEKARDLQTGANWNLSVLPFLSHHLSVGTSANSQQCRQGRHGPAACGWPPRAGSQMPAATGEKGPSSLHSKVD